MMRLLNTIPNTNICGENFGAINSLLEFYRRIKTTTNYYVPGNKRPANFNDIVSKNIKPAWYNSYNYSQIIQIIKIMIINMFKNNPSTNIWGFKEIRYDSNNINYIKDFKELFPQTKVIIQTRENIRDQSDSGWFRGDQNAINYIKKTTNELNHFGRINKDWCYITTFEKMFDRSNLKNIFSFIGCKDSYDENKITEILNNNIKD
jgi:hypothetical protein